MSSLPIGELRSTPQPYADPFETFLSKQRKVKRLSQDHAICLCPVHETEHSNPSYDVKRGADGKVLGICRSCNCTFPEAVAASGLTMRDVSPNHGHVPPSPARRSPQSKTSKAPTRHATADRAIAGLCWSHGKDGGKLVSRHDYCDAAGKLVQVITRFDHPGGKVFGQTHLDGSEWLNTGMPEPRPAYLLPQLLAAAPDEPLVISEGERCTEALAGFAEAADFVVTTSSQGAKCPEKTDWSATRGRHVVIWPDHDADGFGYRDKVGALVRAAGAASVSAIEPGELGLGDAEDAYDWIAQRRAAGRTEKQITDELRDIIVMARAMPEATSLSDTTATTEAIQSEGASLDEGAPTDSTPHGAVDPATATSGIVQVDQQPFHALIDVATSLLAPRPDIGVRDGVLVHVAADERGGPPRVRPATRGWLREVLSRAIPWCAERGRNPSAIINPPADVIEALTERRHSWPGFRVVADVDAPVRDWLEVAKDPTPPMLIGGTVPVGGLIVLGGHANTGKTMLALDASLRLAHGMPEWLGHHLLAGGASTLYLAAEGVGGFGCRLRTWSAAHRDAQPTEHYVAIRGEVPNLASDDAADALSTIIDDTARQRGGRVPDLVTVDTWNAAMPGADENDAGATGAALHALAALRRRYGCTVIVLHHPRKPTGSSSKSSTMHDLRGSGALAGAADVILVADGQTLAAVKVRDGARGSPSPYVIAPHPTERAGEIGGVALPGPRDAAAAPAAPAPEDVSEARAEKADREAFSDAATVARILAQQPGIKATKLEDRATADTKGGMGDRRFRRARGILFEAIVELPGSRNSKLLYLDGSKVPAEVLEKVPPTNRRMVTTARPDPDGLVTPSHPESPRVTPGATAPASPSVTPLAPYSYRGGGDSTGATPDGNSSSAHHGRGNTSTGGDSVDPDSAAIADMDSGMPEQPGGRRPSGKRA